MAKIAILGLGQMGAPMVTRLLQAGHELTVWNRTPDRAKPLAAVRSIAARFPEGVAVVDAPVRGSVSQAADVRSILESLGSVVHIGGLGAGAAMKLVAPTWRSGRRSPLSARRWRWVRRWGLAGRRC